MAAAGSSGDQNGLIETTVTFLQMQARPPLPPIAAPAIRHALLRVENCPIDFYRYLYDVVGRDWYWVDRKRLGDKALGAILADPKTEIYVLYAEGWPAGYFELDLRDHPRRINLSYFGLVKEAIGKGMGRWLLAQAIEIAWDRAPHVFTVNTCTLDHPSALPLYQRMGFVVYDRMKAFVDPKV
jgi:GNAT superfamily N-acetyltransferase